MAVAGTLKAVLTADTAQFKSGLENARGNLQKFKSNVSESHKEAGKFNTELLTSRTSLSIFASATGTSAMELHHLVSAFEMGGVAMGLLVGGFLLGKAAIDEYNEGVKRQAEATAEATKKQIEFFNALQKTSQALGQTPKDSALTDTLKKEIKDAQEQIAKIKAAQKEAAESGKYYEGGKLKQGLSKADDAKVNALQRLIQSDNDQILKQKNNDLFDSLRSSGGAGDIDQQVGQDLGVFRLEHGENQQIALLEQIAANTAAASTTKPNVSNFDQQ